MFIVVCSDMIFDFDNIFQQIFQNNTLIVITEAINENDGNVIF